jgi:lipid II:glycine glycyltransferase (peptidoglycan interpeptide bridge formation enzyme)
VTDVVREATPDERRDWDIATVDATGGHVYQSEAWAAHRAAAGWRPRFLMTTDGGRVLALERDWPMVGGSSAYIPRGPVPCDVPAENEDADPSMALARRLIEVAEALATDGVDVVAADAEVPAADAGYGASIRAAGFVPIEEIQPSRHRIALPLLPGDGEEAAFAGIAKSTRQRVRAAERDAVVVVRHDRRQVGGVAGEGFAAPEEPGEVALDRFYDLLLETGERRRFGFGPRDRFVPWWVAALRAGHLVYLEARHETAGGEVLAGLVLYRHGGRLSTVHSGDHDASRTTHPGALHLLRWRAIQLAVREGCREMDLGGVDVAGARREPVEGEPMYGLYQHKRSFGGTWVALTGAHERVADGRGYALGRAAMRAQRVLRR